MKTKIMFRTSLAALLALFVSCGQKSQTPTDGPLGEMPAIIGECNQLKKEKMLEMSRMGSGQESEMEAAVNAVNEAEKAMKEKLQAAQSAIKGREVPTEADAALPLKVTKKLSVENIDELHESVQLTGEVELTSRAIGFKPYEGTDAFVLDNVYAVSYDAAGNPCAYDKLGLSTEGKEQPAGARINVETSLHIEGYNAAALGGLSKLVITQKGSALYEAAKKAVGQLKADYEQAK